MPSVPPGSVQPGSVQPVIRAALPEEVEAVGDLTVSVYVADGLANEGYLFELRNAAGRAASTTLLVAVDESTGSLLGSVALVDEGGPYAELAGPGEAEIRMLVVAPHARGRGIGEAMTRECLARARAKGCTRMVLSTQTTMRTAHRLYERLGFRRVPELDWSPAPGVDLLAYGLDL